MYTKDYFEIMSDAMDEIREWLEYEADMTEMAVEPPSDEDIEMMFLCEVGR